MNFLDAVIWAAQNPGNRFFEMNGVKFMVITGTLVWLQPTGGWDEPEGVCLDWVVFPQYFLEQEDFLGPCTKVEL